MQDQHADRHMGKVAIAFRQGIFSILFRCDLNNLLLKQFNKSSRLGCDEGQTCEVSELREISYLTHQVSNNSFIVNLQSR